MAPSSSAAPPGAWIIWAVHPTTAAPGADGIINRVGEALRRPGMHLVWQLGTRERAIDLAPALVLTSAAEAEPLIDELARKFSVSVMSAFPGLDVFIGIRCARRRAGPQPYRLCGAVPKGSGAQVEDAPCRHLGDGATLAPAKLVAFTVPADRAEAAAALNRLRFLLKYGNENAWAFSSSHFLFEINSQPPRAPPRTATFLAGTA